MENASRSIALAALAWAITACGSGQESGEASLVNQADLVAFAQCVRENGMPDFKDPAPDVAMDEAVDFNSPAFKKAAEACKDVMPTPFLRNNGDENWSAADKRAYAACMRSNGAPSFPDPDTSGGFKLDDDDHPDTPQFKKAEEACQQYQPQGLPSMIPSKTGGS